ncbi:MAG: diacylglycerol kinase family protein [Bacteroidia bacterium]|nr:diacylglycerol kinase family protein [Bacteroidia bacterium]
MKKFIKSVNHAFDGLKYMFLTQRNFKIQIFIALIALVMAVFLKIEKTEWAILALSITVVWSFEIINTSIEKLCDFVNPEFNSTVKVIKDLSAGAVLLVSTGALLTGFVIFLPKIF